MLTLTHIPNQPAQRCNRKERRKRRKRKNRRKEGGRERGKRPIEPVGHQLN